MCLNAYFTDITKSIHCGYQNRKYVFPGWITGNKRIRSASTVKHWVLQRDKFVIFFGDYIQCK